jgi:fructoselysine-6-P-deglycase FrlB-like protein
MTVDECIAEQPEVLDAVLAEVPGQLARLAPIQSARPIYLVGSGTSRNALAAVEPLLGRLVPAGVRVRGPLTFLAETAAMRRGKGLAIFLSQTGTTAAIVQAVARAASLGWRALTVTADRRSPIGLASAETVVMPIGPEPVGPKTKGYTASLLTLILLARAMAGQEMQSGDFTGELSRLIAYARGVVAELAEMREGCDFFMILGQERHYATALEASLKISEMSGMAAAAFDTEEAFHGRFHGLSSFSASLFVAGTPAQYDMAAAGAAVLSDLGIASRILNLTASLPGPHDLPLPWPATDACAELDLISAIVPFQLLACDLARRRGLSPERMRYPDLAQRLQVTTGLAD